MDREGPGQLLVSSPFGQADGLTPLKNTKKDIDATFRLLRRLGRKLSVRG